MAHKSNIVGKECQLKHVAFGTVNGKDGKPFKTREGGVMRLADLIEQARDCVKNRCQKKITKNL